MLNCTAREYTSAGRFARPRTRPGCWWFPDRCRQYVPLTARSLSFFFHAGNQVANVGAAVEQFVQALQDRFAIGFAGVGVERGIPLLCRGFHFGVYFVEFFAEILFNCAQLDG